MNLLKLLLLVIAMAAGMICLAQQSPRSYSSAAGNILLAAESTNKAPDGTAKIKLPKLLDLGSKKCIPCKMMAPVLEKLEKEYAGIMDVEFIDVWIKENADKAKKFEIESIPTQIFFDAGGKELARHAGYISEEDILKKWKELGYDFEKLKKEKAADRKQYIYHEKNREYN
jgi:thioredoxin 1